MSKPSAKGKKKTAYETMGIPTIPPSVVPKILHLSRTTSSKIPVCFIGESGIGKTAIVKQWAQEQGGEAIILNFAHMAPEDIGIPMLKGDGETYGFAIPEFMKKANEIAEKKGIAVLFMDEWNRGEPQLVNALFTLADTRRLHSHELHENVMVVGAMNPSDGSYQVNRAERDHAVRRRMSFIYVTPSPAAFLSHARKAEYHHKVVGFIDSDTTTLYDEQARESGMAFACPSNWEKVSEILKGSEENKLDLGVTTALIAGQIGEGMTQKFMAYYKDDNVAVNTEDILFSYTKRGTDVRKKILGLAGRKLTRGGKVVPFTEKEMAKQHIVQNTGRLSEIVDNISAYIEDQLPDPDKIMNNLGQFLLDCPEEVTYAFTYQRMRPLRDSMLSDNGDHDVESAKVFWDKFHVHINTNDIWAEIMERMHQNQMKFANS